MTAIIAERTNFLEKALQALTQLPPFSPILSNLMASLAQEDVSVAELSDWIEKDAVIAGQVLRLVNSAAYGRRGNISSVRHAVAILGMLKLRNVVLGMSVSRMWNQLRTPRGWSTSRFNLHAAATAIATDLIAQHAPVDYGEGAFVAGLLHDMGKLVIALGLSDEYALIQRLREETGRLERECEVEVIGFDHAWLSGAVLERWALPHPIRDAVAYHHDPGKAPAVKADSIKLGRALEIGDQVVNASGVSINPAKTAPPVSPEGSLESIGLGSRSQLILEAFQKEFETLKSFF